MNLFLLQQYQFINDIYKNENYLDVLMNIDDFFDIFVGGYLVISYFVEQIVPMPYAEVA